MFESRVQFIDKESNLARFPIRSGGRRSEVFNCYFISTLSVVCCLLIGKNSEVAAYHAELSADNSELEKDCKSTFKHKRWYFCHNFTNFLKTFFDGLFFNHYVNLKKTYYMHAALTSYSHRETSQKNCETPINNWKYLTMNHIIILVCIRLLLKEII